MSQFEQELNRRLEALRSEGLYRKLRRVDSAQGPRIRLEGEPVLNFSSNDYLGLAAHPEIKAAAVAAVTRFGVGSGASRLLSGSLAPHAELDQALAEFKGTEAALSFASGYATALGVICAILGKDDFIVLDKLVHACIVDAARLCGAKIRVFAHNDLDDLARILKWTADRVAAAAGSATPRVLVATESVFSMDGDHAPLRQLVELKERYGAWLMVDEAHATGLYGTHGRGLAEAAGVSDRIELRMGTLGKALGSSGGFICGSRTLVDYLVNRARSFIFSTAPVPAAAAAATAAVRLVQSPAGEAFRETLWRQVNQFHAGMGAPRPNHSALSAIIPLLIGGEKAATDTADSLREQGIYIPAIRYPTVAKGSARLRLTITAAHTAADIEQVCARLKALGLSTTPPVLHA